MPRPTKYARYQDYVIRDGVLVGEFEEMYRDFDDPWLQTAGEHDVLDKAIGVALLKKHAHRRPLEYGCGLGHYTARLQRELGAAAGVDISPTAIDKARRRYAEPSFFVGDIASVEPLHAFKPDALVLAEITWYVLDRLGSFKQRMSQESKGRGFLHILTVYPPGEQAYGTGHFTNHEEIMAYWSDAVDIEESGQVSTKGQSASRSFFYGRVR